MHSKQCVKGRFPIDGNESATELGFAEVTLHWQTGLRACHDFCGCQYKCIRGNQKSTPVFRLYPALFFYQGLCPRLPLAVWILGIENCFRVDNRIRFRIQSARYWKFWT